MNHAIEIHGKYHRWLLVQGYARLFVRVSSRARLFYYVTTERSISISRLGLGWSGTGNDVPFERGNECETKREKWAHSKCVHAYAQGIESPLISLIPRSLKSWKSAYGSDLFDRISLESLENIKENGMEGGNWINPSVISAPAHTQTFSRVFRDILITFSWKRER